jgi:hypothetical protein
MALTHIDYLTGLEKLVPKALLASKMDKDGFVITEWGDSRVQPTNQQIEAAYNALAYFRSREAEYPAIQELVVALYDTDDRAAVDAKRAAVKAKYPKP